MGTEGAWSGARPLRPVTRARVTRVKRRYTLDPHWEETR